MTAQLRCDRFSTCSWICLILLFATLRAAAQLNDPGTQMYSAAAHASGLAAYQSKRYADAMRLMRPFALRGDPAAEFIVGNILADGLEQPRNVSLGLQYMMKSADQGYPQALGAMGMRYVFGQGVPRDTCKALDLFRRGYAQDRNAFAMNLGNMYKDGLCVPRDAHKALLFYHQSPDPDARLNEANARQASTPEAQATIDRATRLDEQGKFREAIVLLTPLADQGEMHAQEELGYTYWWNAPSRPNSAGKAAEYFKRAADQGSGYGEAMLGSLYELGAGGLAKDEAKAFQLYQSSAEKKTAAGLFFLARAYEFGIGTKKDRDKAIQGYTRAGQQGDDAGQHFAEFLKDPSNIDFRTDAEYQAYMAKVRADDAARAKARTNVACGPKFVTVGSTAEHVCQTGESCGGFSNPTVSKWVTSCRPGG